MILYGDISDEQNLSRETDKIKARFPDKAYTGKREDPFDFNSKEFFVAHRSSLTSTLSKIDRIFNSSPLPEEFIPGASILRINFFLFLVMQKISIKMVCDSTMKQLATVISWREK